MTEDDLAAVERDARGMLAAAGERDPVLRGVLNNELLLVAEIRRLCAARDKAVAEWDAHECEEVAGGALDAQAEAEQRMFGALAERDAAIARAEAAEKALADARARAEQANDDWSAEHVRCNVRERQIEEIHQSMECEREWSNLHDLGACAIEQVADVVAALAASERERDEARAALAEAARWAAHRTAEIAELLTERGEANADLSTARTESASAVAALAAAEETIETLRGECGADGHAPWCREWKRMEQALRESEAREAALREAVRRALDGDPDRAALRGRLHILLGADPSPRVAVLLAAEQVMADLVRQAVNPIRCPICLWENDREHDKCSFARYEIAADAAALSPARPASQPTAVAPSAASAAGEPDALTRAAVAVAEASAQHAALVSRLLDGDLDAQAEAVRAKLNVGVALSRYIAARDGRKEGT